MKKLQLIVLLIISVTCCARNESDLKKYRLCGKVFKEVSISYGIDTITGESTWLSSDTSIFDERGFQLLRVYISADTDQNFTEVFTYNSRGLLESDITRRGDKIDEAEYTWYNKHGDDSVMTQRDKADEDGTWVTEKYFYHYNSKYQLIEGWLSEGDNDTAFDKPVLKWRNYFWDNGKLKRQESIDNGRIISTTEYNKMGKSLKTTSRNNIVTSKYDKKGNLEISKVLDAKGVLLSTTYYSLSPDGDVTIDKTVWPNGKVANEYKRVYENPDLHGNWTMQTRYDNGKKAIVVKRMIEYYK